MPGPLAIAYPWGSSSSRVPGTLVVWSLTPAEDLTIFLAVVLAVLIAVIAYRSWQESKIPPEEWERQRRLMLVGRGQICDATLVEVRDELLFYCYDVRGVEYTASQEVTALKQYLPDEISVDSPVSVKYDPRNPANSIVLAEQWSGLRARKVS